MVVDFLTVVLKCRLKIAVKLNCNTFVDKL